MKTILALAACLVLAACSHGGTNSVTPGNEGFTGADNGLEFCRSVCTGSPDVRIWSPNNKTDVFCQCFCPAGNGFDLSFDARQPRDKSEASWSSYTSHAGCT